MVRLVPRDTKFFDLFTEMAENIVEGAKLLKAILEDFVRGVLEDDAAWVEFGRGGGLVPDRRRR